MAGGVTHQDTEDPRECRSGRRIRLYLRASTQPHDDNPRYDLDRVSASLVKSYERQHGTVYPGMAWDPKQAFNALAAFYARQAGGS
jgi:hypothetical protein